MDLKKEIKLSDLKPKREAEAGSRRAHRQGRRRRQKASRSSSA